MNKLVTFILFVSLDLVPLKAIAMQNLTGNNQTHAAFFINQGTLRSIHVLQIYAKNGRIKQLQDAIEKYKLSPQDQDTEGNTPLHHAALCGQQEIFEYLLRIGANVTTKNKKGLTPLIKNIVPKISF